jgi:predicted HicB family RNase H-like nuclease
MDHTEQATPRVPHFKSREEAAAWFDTHDVGDYLDEFKRVEVQVDKNLSRSLNVRLAPEIFAELQQQAEAKGIGASTLGRMWILEHLQPPNGKRKRQAQRN